jgi:hypothetical protein
MCAGLLLATAHARRRVEVRPPNSRQDAKVGGDLERTAERALVELDALSDATDHYRGVIDRHPAIDVSVERVVGDDAWWARECGEAAYTV